jgi:NADPH-dependent ferric siderophore reductase
MSSIDVVRSTRRIRHETRMRLLTVQRVQCITPKMVRVTLGGAELAGFTSAAADDHVKLYFPVQPGGAPLLPASAPAGAQAIGRDYTPRRFDVASGELDIEFALHGDGPAAAWATQAAPGQLLAVGGPRGSFVVSGDFDWYLLVADDAGLPALARRLEELPPGARAYALAEVADIHEQQSLQSAASLQLTWLHRNGARAGEAERFATALRALRLPAGVGYTWIASESGVARSLRQLLLTERGFEQQWLKASGYWKHGASATHDKIEE